MRRILSLRNKVTGRRRVSFEDFEPRDVCAMVFPPAIAAADTHNVLSSITVVGVPLRFYLNAIRWLDLAWLAMTLVCLILII